LTVESSKPRRSRIADDRAKGIESYCAELAVTGDAAVFAAEIEQRFSFVNFRIVDFRDKDRVIAGEM
jgi:hypothetical protein